MGRFCMRSISCSPRAPGNAVNCSSRRAADVRIVGAPRRPGRIVAIPIETLRLADDLFGVDLAALQVGLRVERRRVDWAAGSAATVAQVAFVCDIADFAAALSRPLRDA